MVFDFKGTRDLENLFGLQKPQFFEISCPNPQKKPLLTDKGAFYSKGTIYSYPQKLSFYRILLNLQAPYPQNTHFDHYFFQIYRIERILPHTI